jgi:hypothetical protein
LRSEDGPAPRVEDAGARAERIHRGLRRGRDPLRQYRWRGWSFADCSFLAGALLCVPLLLLEPALLPRHPVPPLAPLPGLLALWLLPLLPVHGWILVRMITSRGETAGTPAAWLAGCRFVLAGLPVLGLFALPWWRRLEAARPAWAFGPAHAPRPLELREAAPSPAARGPAASPRPPGPRRAHGLSAAAALIAISVALPTAWALWLGGNVTRDDGYRLAAVTACGALHLTVAACASHYLWGLRRQAAPGGWRAWAPLWVPFLGLVPFAGVPVILLGLLVLDLRAAGNRSLVSAVYDRRWSAGRLPLWMGLEAALRKQWQAVPWWRRVRRPAGLERPAMAGRAERGRLALVRWKSLATFFDSVALAWAMMVLARRHPAHAPGVAALLRGLWYGSLAAAGAGLAERGLLLAARLLRHAGLVERLDRHPYGRALLGPYVAFAAGTLAGELLASGNAPGLTIFLSLTGALCAIAGAIVLMLQTVLAAGRTVRVESHDALPAPLLILALLVVEMALVKGGGGPAVVTGLQVAAVLSPLGSALCGLLLGHWLAWPCRCRDVFAARLQPGVRGLLALLAITATLPLGGLAAPLWILVRHRAWPLAVAGLPEARGALRPPRP